MWFVIASSYSFCVKFQDQKPWCPETIGCPWFLMQKNRYQCFYHLSGGVLKSEKKSFTFFISSRAGFYASDLTFIQLSSLHSGLRGVMIGWLWRSLILFSKCPMHFFCFSWPGYIPVSRLRNNKKIDILLSFVGRSFKIGKKEFHFFYQFPCRFLR